MKSFANKVLARNRRTEEGTPRGKPPSMTTWISMGIIVIAGIIYTNPQFEVIEEQTIHIPKRSFHGYGIHVHEKKSIGVEIDSLNGQAFDFYVLPTDQFEMLKHLLVEGRPEGVEVQFLYRKQDTKDFEMHGYKLKPGRYTLVIDNAYWDRADAKEHLLVDFKILEEKSKLRR